LIACCLIPLLALPVASQAGVIGAEEYLDAVDRRATLDRIDAVLAREEVAAALERQGVEPEAALARAEALSHSELQLLAENLEELPAGGSLVGTVGVVFVVLLILELVGVIDIVKKI
jgi:hypothetical protein